MQPSLPVPKLEVDGLAIADLNAEECANLRDGKDLRIVGCQGKIVFHDHFKKLTNSAEGTFSAIAVVKQPPSQMMPFNPANQFIVERGEMYDSEFDACLEFPLYKEVGCNMNTQQEMKTTLNGMIRIILHIARGKTPPFPLMLHYVKTGW